MSNLNPYSEFKNDPFEVSRLCSFNALTFSIFKKLSCAGIAGRAKDRDKDLTEAAFTLRRLISEIEDGKHWVWAYPQIFICEIMAEYAPPLPDWQRRALQLLLECHYHNYIRIELLRDCVALIEERLTIERRDYDV